MAWGGIPVKEGILSVRSLGYLTAASEMILLGVSTKHIEVQKNSWVRISNKIIITKKNVFQQQKKYLRM